MPSRYSFIPAAAVTDSELTDGDIRVLAALGVFTDTETKECYPGVATIAKRCLMEPRSVQRSLVRLIAGGHVTRVYRPGHSNLYSVLLDGHLRSSTERQHGHPTPDPTVTHIVPIERKDKEEAKTDIGILPPAAPTGAGGEAWRVTEMMQSLEAKMGRPGPHLHRSPITGIPRRKEGRK